MTQYGGLSVCGTTCRSPRGTPFGERVRELLLKNTPCRTRFEGHPYSNTRWGNRFGGIALAPHLVDHPCFCPSVDIRLPPLGLHLGDPTSWTPLAGTSLVDPNWGPAAAYPPGGPHLRNHPSNTPSEALAESNRGTLFVDLHWGHPEGYPPKVTTWGITPGLSSGEPLGGDTLMDTPWGTQLGKPSDEAPWGPPFGHCYGNDPSGEHD